MIYDYTKSNTDGCIRLAIDARRITDATNMLDESDKTAQNGRRERFWQKKITALQNLHPSPQNRALYNFSSAVHTILHHMIKQVALIAGSL